MLMKSMPGREPLLNLFLRNETITRTVSVEELMFKGMGIAHINAVILEGNGTIPDAFQGDLFGLYRGVYTERN